MERQRPVEALHGGVHEEVLTDQVAETDMPGENA